MNTYYSLLGRRCNIDMKAERNVSGEIEASQSNFDILESYSYRLVGFVLYINV